MIGQSKSKDEEGRKIGWIWLYTNLMCYDLDD